MGQTFSIFRAAMLLIYEMNSLPHFLHVILISNSPGITAEKSPATLAYITMKFFHERVIVF